MFKTQKHCSSILFRQSDVDVMHAGFAKNFIDVEAVEGYIRPVLYPKDIVDVLRMEVLLAWNKDDCVVFFTIDMELLATL